MCRCRPRFLRRLHPRLASPRSMVSPPLRQTRRPGPKYRRHEGHVVYARWQEEGHVQCRGRKLEYVARPSLSGPSGVLQSPETLCFEYELRHTSKRTIGYFTIFLTYGWRRNRTEGLRRSSEFELSTCGLLRSWECTGSARIAGHARWRPQPTSFDAFSGYAGKSVQPPFWRLAAWISQYCPLITRIRPCAAFARRAVNVQPQQRRDARYTKRPLRP
jgi:hypothetical protein